MVYYYCHCMSLRIGPSDCFFILDSRLSSFLGKKLSFCISVCSVLIAVLLL